MLPRSSSSAVTSPVNTFSVVVTPEAASDTTSLEPIVMPVSLTSSFFSSA